MIGPVVREVSESFDGYWNNELAYPATALLGREPTRDEFRERRDTLAAFVAGQSESAYQRALRDSDLANRLTQKQVRFEWGQAHVVQDEPEKILADRSQTAYHLAPQLRPYFRDVENATGVKGSSGTSRIKVKSIPSIRIPVCGNDSGSAS